MENLADINPLLAIALASISSGLFLELIKFYKSKRKEETETKIDLITVYSAEFDKIIERMKQKDDENSILRESYFRILKEKELLSVTDEFLEKENNILSSKHEELDNLNKSLKEKLDKIENQLKKINGE